MNNILKQGVVTPFVVFTFPTGFTIESSTSIPRYFVSLSHNRTCKKACTFKLTVTYVPDTFKYGEPYLLDQQILSSTGGKVVYCYGYYDRFGRRHMQQCSYVGQVFTYSSDIDIINGTINYTIEGTASAADLSNSMARIDATANPVKPSQHLLDLVNKADTGGFRDLRDFYEIDANDHRDEDVYIPNFDSAPVLDLIMGTVTENKSNGLPVRKGGLVQLSNGPEMSPTEAASLGIISSDNYDLMHNTGSYTVNSAGDALLEKTQWRQRKKQVTGLLKYPFICYIDDTETTSGKLGTLKYVCRTTYSNSNAPDNYVYCIGNNQRDSDVLSFSVNYDGAVARAGALATGKTVSGIDANGNGIGQTWATTQTKSLGKNTFDSMNGIEQNLLISLKEISDIMIYPYEATLQIVGQTVKNELLDVIHITVLLNGTVHQTLTGNYQILEINDEISSSGFTTEFRLVRQVNSATLGTQVSESFILEQPTTTANVGDVANTQSAINSVVPESSTTSGNTQNRQ